MAWYDVGPAMIDGAGALKALLDAYLPLNPYWSIKDAAAGANIGVYRNHDAARNSDFVLYVDDTAASYSYVQLWEDWDAVAHAGVGASVTTTLYSARLLTFLKGTSREKIGWSIRVSDHHFLLHGHGTNTTSVGNPSTQTYYVGQLRRFDESKNMPICICKSNTNTIWHSAGQTVDPICMRNWDVAGSTEYRAAILVALFDETGAASILHPPASREPNVNHSGSYNVQVIRTISGEILIEEAVIYSHNTKRLMGILDGVVQLPGSGSSTSGMMQPGYFSVYEVDGVFWKVVGGNSNDQGALVRMS